MNRWFVVLILLCAALPTRAQTVITFDDLPGSELSDPISNGYAGLNWDNFNYLTPSSVYNGSGYDNGTVSETNVALNTLGNSASFSAAAPFTFSSAYLAGAWNDGLNIDIKGFLGTTELFSQTVIVNTGATALFNFDWAGVDTITFNSYGGIDNPALVNGEGTMFVLDNLTLNAPVPTPSVPEPGSLALFFPGMAAMALMIRRKSTA